MDRFAGRPSPIVFLVNARAPDTPAGRDMTAGMPRLNHLVRLQGDSAISAPKRPQTPLGTPDALEDGKPYPETSRSRMRGVYGAIRALLESRGADTALSSPTGRHQGVPASWSWP